MDIKSYMPMPVKRKLRQGFNRIRGQLYLVDAMLHQSSTKYYCPCCNKYFRSWVSFRFDKQPGIYNPERYKNTEQKVICPVCRTIPRHRILALWFQKHRDELKGNILYFACESGIKMWLDRNKVKYTTADLFTKADLKLDIQNTGLPDNSWDWVICNHVLEHVDNYKQALKEMYRILKPGGRLICSFPILENLPTLIEETEPNEDNKAERIKLYGQFDHLRVFGADSENLLRSVGFEVSRIEGSKCPKAIMPIDGPADYDVNYLFVCWKQTSLDIV